MGHHRGRTDSVIQGKDCMSHEDTALDQRLFEQYDRYKEPALFHRRFKHADLQPLIDDRRSAGLLEVREAGRSFEGRSISLLSVGRGPVKVFLWSQMHGDEPTATMALFDIFRFLENHGDGFDDFRASLFENLTLYFLPMLNPDGAQRYQRVTAQEIDMNRDALALQTPEARLLMDLVEELDPDFGFNLHDQNPRYTAGRSPKLATISFLATAYDFESSLNEVRYRAMQVIGCMNEKLQRYIPNQVGRFSDEHEPRAFGDQIQKRGTSLILVESGGFPGDPEKQFIRKLNFVALLQALGEISSGSYTRKTRGDYDAIPYNERHAFDLLVRHVRMVVGDQSYSLDIGIDRTEVNTVEARDFYYESSIGEIGDLHTKFGIEELDAEKLVFNQGGLYPHPITSPEMLPDHDVITFFKAGYTFFSVSGGVARAIESGSIKTAVHWLREGDPLPEASPAVGNSATFLLKEGEKIRYAVVNGFVYDLT